jgi:hypothetical protein
VNLAFNYTDSVSSSSAAASRGTKRGSYATQRMLADRASQLDAEQQSSGQPSAWVSVYTMMRCPGSPCNLGPYCWRDPFGKQHYKLSAHHLRALVRLVEQGYQLESHNDVPEDIRDQLHAENQRRLERRTTTSGAPTPCLPPITINNVMPSPASESPSTASVGRNGTSRQSSSGKSCLDIPGPREVARRFVRDIEAWAELYKVEYTRDKED